MVYRVILIICNSTEFLVARTFIAKMSLVWYSVKAMRKDIHPKDYRKVLFIDNSNGAEFIINSTVATVEKAKSKSDKKEYPLYRLEVSSASHPFYTGNEKSLDTAGRAEKFKARVAKAKKLAK